MKTLMIAHSLTHSALCLALVAANVGCSIGKKEGWKFSQSWDIRRAVGWKQDEIAPPQIPSRLVSTWTETTLNRTGETPQRGFGGRLLFFDEGSEDSIRVAGQLVVYAYDDSEREAHETQPTRRFVFPSEQFVRHESASKVGPSYSVWLPWDEVGGVQKQISLIARFEPQGGPLLVGEQTRHLLPGTRQLASGEKAPAIEAVNNIRLTRYTQESQLELPNKAPPSWSMPASTLPAAPLPATSPTATPTTVAQALSSPAMPSPSQRAQVTSITLPSKSWEKRLQLPTKRQKRRRDAGTDATATAATAALSSDSNQ